MENETFDLGLGKVLPISVISEKLGRSQSELLDSIRERIEEYTLLFGIRPLILEYLPGTGFVLRADSQIGYFVVESFAIRLLPKIKEISLTKILRMAQKTESGFLNIQNEFIRSTLVSDQDFTSLQLLSISFLDCLESLIRDGLAFGWIEDGSSLDSNHGEILIQEWVSKGKSLPLPRSEISKSVDIPVNRFLVRALDFILKEIPNIELRELSLRIRDYMSDVKDSVDESELDSITLQVLSYPREDYRRAFTFARALLSGGSFEGDGGISKMPTFVLNLDVIFESYCAYMLKKLLDTTVYAVEIQKSTDHDSTPKLPGTIKPDLVVRNLKNSKSLVLDTKNKVVSFDEKNFNGLPNQDVFQLAYYAQTLKSQCAILLYPASKVNRLFPVQGSESPEEYERKVTKFLVDTTGSRFSLFPGSARIQLVPWQIDLSGTLENTELSVARLAFFIGKVLE